MRGWKLGAAGLTAAALCVSAVRARAEEEAPPPGSETEAREHVRGMEVEVRRACEQIDRMHGIVLTQQCAVEVAKKMMREAIDKRMEVEAELKQARAETAKLREENVRLEKELAGLRRIVERLPPEALDLPRARAEEPARQIRARVLAVRPDLNMVMLSVGADERVKKGHLFAVYRGEKHIGEVEVVKVFADMCSARILPDRLKGPIKEGDDAALRLIATPPLGDAGGARPAAPGGGEPEPRREVRCKIIAVRPEVNLVMLSAGRDDGVKTGRFFAVYRGRSYFAKVEVEKVFADMSSARILRQRKPIRQGDDAWTHLMARAPEEPRREGPDVPEAPPKAPAAKDDAVF